MIDRDEAIAAAWGLNCYLDRRSPYSAARVVDTILALDRPPVVTDEMVERACRGYADGEPFVVVNWLMMRAALEAALREASDDKQKPVFGEYFATEMKKWARETLVNELSWVYGDSILSSPEKARKARERARARVDAMDDDAVMEILEATAPKPCPTCGHIP